MADVFGVLAEILTCHFASDMLMLYNQVLWLGTMSVHVDHLKSCRGLKLYRQKKKNNMQHERIVDIKSNMRQNITVL